MNHCVLSPILIIQYILIKSNLNIFKKNKACYEPGWVLGSSSSPIPLPPPCKNSHQLLSTCSVPLRFSALPTLSIPTTALAPGNFSLSLSHLLREKLRHKEGDSGLHRQTEAELSFEACSPGLRTHTLNPGTTLRSCNSTNAG